MIKKPASTASTDSEPDTPSSSNHRWTFLTNHTHVLICLAREPDVRLRDVAEQVGITERAVQGIVSDLEAEGLITRVREGRRNRYILNTDEALRHAVASYCTVEDLLKMAGVRRGSA